ncbi:aminotransferase [Microlunatus endophyticus]|uniref:Aminotransferase n=1 Tax=Microlunatus endophyticus TaxID=1716077 RepID=A0A917W0L5_9ACTN|nr:succinyldiaminopimelate transaminase [Microlunatus endophyticus]GGL47431.1 aminotransferase [Microlunatus endophyticus]
MTNPARPNPLAAALADYPWDALAPAKQRAAAHPGGIVDLSIGTPVDDTPEVAVEALSAAGNSPGYPTVAGTPALRSAAAGYLGRRAGADVAPDAVLPTIGSKEFVAWLPTQLALGPDDVVVIPEAAYPTYEAGAVIAGCRVVATDDLTGLGGVRPKLVWLNSPSNPTGRIADAAKLRATVELARSWGAVVASDECYLEFAWDAPAVSVLDPRVSGGDHTGLLAVHSLSKIANLAGYRAGFVAGDPQIIAELTSIRRHAGMIVSRPVQQAMIALLSTDEHVDAQRERYRARRQLLRPALERAGFRVDDSQGSLYLWISDSDGDCWKTVDRLADLGILVGPGAFYGKNSGDHVRVALTATDERIQAAVERLSTAS